MSNELEDFLARILQANTQKKPQHKLPPRPTAPHPGSKRPPQRVTPTDIDDLEVVAANVVTAEAIDKPRRLRSTTDLSSRDISEHADRLGHKFDTPKKSGVGAQVKAYYNHQVGRLASTADAPAILQDGELAEGAPVDILEQIVKMMQTPQGLRQAVILQEILLRPEHRW